MTGSSWDRDKARDIGGDCETYLHEHKNIQRKIKGHQRQDDVQLMRQLNLAAALISTELSHENDSETFTSGRDQLLLLMNLTPFPASLSDKSANTRRVIEKANDAEALYRCIPEIADLTSAMKLQLQSEIDDLRSFLRSPVERLVGLETQIKQSNDFHNESMDNGFNLERKWAPKQKACFRILRTKKILASSKTR